MAVQPWENALLKKVGESGNDGETDNDKRTLAFYVGGHDFSIVLVDSAGVQNDVRFRLITLTPLTLMQLIMLYIHSL